MQYDNEGQPLFNGRTLPMEFRWDRRPDSDRKVGIAKLSCRSCHSTIDVQVSSSSDNLFPANMIQRRVRAQGWEMHKRYCSCPGCNLRKSADDHDETLEGAVADTINDDELIENVKAVVPHTVAVPAYDHLNRVFNKVNGRYKPLFSDAKLAELIGQGATEEMVAQVRRDFFGELWEDPEIEALKGEVEVWGDRILDAISNLQADQAQTQDAQFAALDGIQADLDKGREMLDKMQATLETVRAEAQQRLNEFGKRIIEAESSLVEKHGEVSKTLEELSQKRLSALH